MSAPNAVMHTGATNKYSCKLLGMNWRIRKAHSRGNAIVVTHALRLRRWSPFAKWTDKRLNVNNCAENPANLLRNTLVSLDRHESVKKQQLVATHTRTRSAHTRPPARSLSGIFMNESKMHLPDNTSQNHRQRSRGSTDGSVLKDL